MRFFTAANVFAVPIKSEIFLLWFLLALTYPYRFELPSTRARSTRIKYAALQGHGEGEQNEISPTSRGGREDETRHGFAYRN